MLTKNFYRYSFLIYISILAVLLLFAGEIILKIFLHKSPYLAIWLVIGLFIALLLFHSVFLFFNYELWYANREYKIAKQISKKNRLLQQNPDILNEIVECGYDFNQMSPKTKSLIEELSLKRAIEKFKKQLDSHTSDIQILNSITTIDSLIENIDNKSLKNELLTSQKCNDKVKLYEKVFEILNTSVNKLIELNYKSFDSLHNSEVLQSNSISTIEHMEKKFDDDITITDNTFKIISEYSVQLQVFQKKVKYLDVLLEKKDKSLDELQKKINNIINSLKQKDEEIKGLNDKVKNANSNLLKEEYLKNISFLGWIQMYFKSR